MTHSNPVSGWTAAELEHVEACPLCAAREHRVLHNELRDHLQGVDGMWTYRQCSHCACAYLNPRPDRSTIGRAYATYYTHTLNNRRPEGLIRNETASIQRVRQALRNDYIAVRYGYQLHPRLRSGAALARVVPRIGRQGDRFVRHLPMASGKGRLLDVGCGNGSFIAQMTTLGWEAEGFDPDPAAVAVAHERGLRVACEELAESALEGRREAFDAITLSHVVEHLHDPVGSLNICRSMLRPGGLLWLATPNLESIGHRRFGAHWRGLEPPRHLVLFTSAALVSALAQAGFSDVRVRGSGAAASRMFRESAEIRRCATGTSGSWTSSTAIRVCAALAETRAGARHTLGEELVITAMRR